MISKNNGNKSSEREDEERALQRAAHSAKQLAARTGTPLVVSKNGEVVRIQVTEDMLKPVTPNEK
jgi:high-affinity K+ transport system ATPase subunit B